MHTLLCVGDHVSNLFQVFAQPLQGFIDSLNSSRPNDTSANIATAYDRHYRSRFRHGSVKAEVHWDPLAIMGDYGGSAVLQGRDDAGPMDNPPFLGDDQDLDGDERVALGNDYGRDAASRLGPSWLALARSSVREGGIRRELDQHDTLFGSDPKDVAVHADDISKDSASAVAALCWRRGNGEGKYGKEDDAYAYRSQDSGEAHGHFPRNAWGLMLRTRCSGQATLCAGMLQGR